MPRPYYALQGINKETQLMEVIFSDYDRQTVVDEKSCTHRHEYSKLKIIKLANDSQAFDEYLSKVYHGYNGRKED